MYAWLYPILIQIALFTVGELVIRALTAIGFGIVTTYGLGALLDYLKIEFINDMNGLPANTLAFVSLMRIDDCFTLISSAVVAKYMISGWNQTTDSNSHAVFDTKNIMNGGGQ